MGSISARALLLTRTPESPAREARQRRAGFLESVAARIEQRSVKVGGQDRQRIPAQNFPETSPRQEEADRRGPLELKEAV